MAVQGFEVPGFSIQSKENSLRCTVNRGVINMAVFRRDQRGAPAVRITFDQSHAAYVQLLDAIGEVIKAPLNSKQSCGRHRFDPTTKRFIDLWNITIEKDSEMVYKITLTDIEHGGASATFVFRAIGGVFGGADPSNKSKDSLLGIKTFVNWLKMADSMRSLSYEKFDPNNRRGGGNSGNGGSAPVAAAVAPAVASDPDDLPF